MSVRLDVCVFECVIRLRVCALDARLSPFVCASGRLSVCVCVYLRACASDCKGLCVLWRGCARPCVCT